MSNQFQFQIAGKGLDEIIDTLVGKQPAREYHRGALNLVPAWAEFFCIDAAENDVAVRLSVMSKDMAAIFAQV